MSRLMNILRDMELYFNPRFVRRQWRECWSKDPIPLVTHITPRSKLTVLENLPFEIRRVYYLHGIDIAAHRAGHAHRKLKRLMVAVSGGFDVVMEGRRTRLASPQRGLLIPPLAWVELENFSPGAVVLVLASEVHDEQDCIRDREECIRMRFLAGLA